MKKSVILALVLVLALSAFACGKPANLPENTSSPPIVNNDGGDKTTPIPSPEPSETPEFIPEYPLFSDDYYAVIAIGESQYAVYDCMGELVSEFSFRGEDELCSLYPKDALVEGYDLERLEFTCRTPENSYDYSNGIACVDYDALKLRAYDAEGNERYSVDFEFEPDDSDSHPYFLLGGILGFGENDIVFISSRDIISRDVTGHGSSNVKPIPPTIYSKSGKRIKTVSEDTLGGTLFGVLGEYLLISPDDKPQYDGFRLVDINGKTIKENVSAITTCQYFCDSELPICIFEARYVCDSEGVVYDAQLKRCVQLERYTLENLSRNISDDEVWPYTMLTFLPRCNNPDGSISGTVVYESEGISCVEFAALRNYKDNAGYYGNADEHVCWGMSEDRSRMLIHTMQKDYFLSIDDPTVTLWGVNNEVAFLHSESKSAYEMVSLETGETLLTMQHALTDIGENLAVFCIDSKSTPSRYAVYNNEGELLFETDAERVVPTYDDKLIITRGSYTGIADMYGNWLLRGQKLELWA